MQSWTTVRVVWFDSQLSCVPDCYSVLADFLIGCCFHQNQSRTDAGLVEAPTAGSIENKLFLPFHIVTFVDYPH